MFLLFLSSGESVGIIRGAKESIERKIFKLDVSWLVQHFLLNDYKQKLMLEQLVARAAIKLANIRGQSSQKKKQPKIFS